MLAGDAEASGTFVERMRCVPRILAFRNARMGRPLSDHDLADVAQDVLVSLWSKLADFEGRGSLEAWAYTFCFQELMNHIRRKRRTPLPQGGDCTVSEPATEQNPSAELERSETELLLRNISAREAEVVRMRLFEELEMRDVAEQLQISLSSAKTHYYRALEKLRPLLADGLEAGDR